MNDLLDDRLRTMMRTATADAPEAPTVGDLHALVVVGPEPSRPTMRPIAAAAAVLALTAGGALAWWPSGGGENDPADLPETTDTVVPGSYLDAYYLPGALPEGWQIVDSSRYPSGQVAYHGDASVFQTRDGAVRAVVYQEPIGDGEVTASTEAALDPAAGSVPEPEPTPTSATNATWESRDSQLTWRQEGRTIWLTPSDGLEATARSLADDLAASRVDNRVRFTVGDGANWVQTAEHLLDGEPVVSAGANSLTIADDGGGTISLIIERPVGVGLSDAGTPVPGVDDIFVTPSSRRLIVRSAGALEISAFSSTGSASADELVALLVSLEPVSEEEWLAARPDPNELVAGATVVGAFRLLDHTITAHREGAISGVCVERSDGVSGCAHLRGVQPDGELPPATPTEGILLSDGTWVAVGSIANGLGPCDGALLQGARVAVVPNGDVQTMLVVPADLDVSFACSLTGTPDGSPTGNDVFIANPPLTD